MQQKLQTRSVDVVWGVHRCVDGLLCGVGCLRAVTIDVTLSVDGEVGSDGHDVVRTTNIAVRSPAEGVEAGAGGPSTLLLVERRARARGGLLYKLVEGSLVCELSGLDAVDVGRNTMLFLFFPASAMAHDLPIDTTILESPGSWKLDNVDYGCLGPIFIDLDDGNIVSS